MQRISRAILLYRSSVIPAGFWRESRRNLDWTPIKAFGVMDVEAFSIQSAVSVK